MPIVKQWKKDSEAHLRKALFQELLVGELEHDSPVISAGRLGAYCNDALYLRFLLVLSLGASPKGCSAPPRTPDPAGRLTGASLGLPQSISAECL